MLGQLSETGASNDHNVSETPFERQIADRLEGLVPNKRSEPRTHAANKIVRMTAELDVQVRDESRSGMCLRVPRATKVDVNQAMWVAEGNRRRQGIVRWVRSGDAPATKFVGLEWADAVSPWRANPNQSTAGCHATSGEDRKGNR